MPMPKDWRSADTETLQAILDDLTEVVKPHPSDLRLKRTRKRIALEVSGQFHYSQAGRDGEPTGFILTIERPRGGRPMQVDIWDLIATALYGRDKS